MLSTTDICVNNDTARLIGEAVIKTEEELEGGAGCCDVLFPGQGKAIALMSSVQNQMFTDPGLMGFRPSAPSPCAQKAREGLAMSQDMLRGRGRSGTQAGPGSKALYRPCTCLGRVPKKQGMWKGRLCHQRALHLPHFSCNRQKGDKG